MGSKNSKAKTYWREFEKLSLALIEDQFVTEPTSFCLTRASQDGGFDGDMIVEISGKSGFDLSFRALFEAKLRGGNDGVGLRTFAATLVVAHNAAAHALIIVSNQSYTPQAVTEAARFAHATRMKVRLVNGQVVSGWVRQSRQKLLADGHTPEFLDWLMESEPDAMSQSIYEIPLPASGHHFDDAVAHLSIGKNDAGKLDCLIEISKTQTVLQPVVGAQRQAQVRKLIKAMEQSHGVVMLEGDSGSGKSFLLSHAMAGMQREKNASRLDLSSRLTANQLFLLIFQRLTGIELASLLVDESTDRPQIVRILEAALGKQGSPAFLSAVASVILGNGQRAHEQGDLNRSHLADYLGMVAKAQAGLSPFLLICENLNSATSEVLDFLLAVISQLAPHGVLVIELRTDGEAASHSPADWLTFQELFRKTATLDSLKSAQLVPSDAHALVEHYLPGLGPHRAQVICDRVGYSPFLIEIACLWLEQEQVLRRVGTDGQLPFSGVVLQDLETFFEGITPQRAAVVIDGLIKFWARHADPVYQQAIVSAAIMDGSLPLAWLKVLAAPSDEDEAAHRLIDSGLFEYRARDAALLLRHDLLRERCIVFADEKFLVAKKVAERLYPLLEEIHPAGSGCDRIAAKLAFRIGQLAVAFERASNSARMFHAQGQLSDASEMWHVAVQAVEQDDWNAPQRDLRLGQAMLARLEVENDRNRLQQDENAGRLQALETHLAILLPLNEDAELIGRLHLLRWRRFFLLEQFDNAYAVTTQLQQTAGLGDEVQAQILSALAMNHKGAGNKAQAQAQFDAAVQRFPHIGFLRRSSLSNQAAACLDSAPERAIAAYAEISELLEKEPVPPLREVLHLGVDFAMGYFLQRDYVQALLRAEQATAAALSNAFGTQEARARNIAACCYWQRGDLLSASHQIELAVFAAERSYYHRFLWRMRVNAAGIAADRQDWQAAFRHAEAAVHGITGPRLTQFVDPGVRRQRWYVGLLAALHTLVQGGGQAYCAEVIQRLDLPYLDADLQAVTAGAWPAEVFDGRNYVHAGRIMITG